MNHIGWSYCNERTWEFVRNMLQQSIVTIKKRFFFFTSIAGKLCSIAIYLLIISHYCPRTYLFKVTSWVDFGYQENCPNSDSNLHNSRCAYTYKPLCWGNLGSHQLFKGNSSGVPKYRMQLLFSQIDIRWTL